MWFAVRANLSGVVFVTGIPGSGKTTVARLLAERFALAAHIESDLLQLMIVAGGLHPNEEPREEADRQLRMRTRNVSLLADSFAAHGVLPVIDDVLAGRRLDEYLHDLATRPVRVVVLSPPLAVAELRDAQRAEKTVFHLWQHLDAEIRAALEGRGLWIDTAELTSDETVDRVLGALDAAVVA